MTKAIAEGSAIAFHGAPLITLVPHQVAHVVVVSGAPTNERVVEWGPFIMDSTGAILDAVNRFQSGQMGHLEPLLNRRSTTADRE